MTPHFTVAEMRCRCGLCGKLPPQEFVERLELLRVAFGKPLVVSSGARCAEHNMRVSTTGANGPHVVRGAVDITICGADAVELVKRALEHGFVGIGISQRGPHASRFIHIDDRQEPMIWSY